MADGDVGSPAGRKTAVRWSAGMGRRICARVAWGEVLYGVLREAGMPTPQSLKRWARERPAFGAALEAARVAGGRPDGGGVWGYAPEIGETVFQRLCAGESLTAIAADPLMPCLSTLYHWRRRLPEFAETVRAGREAQAERFCDLGWEMACAATPETAYLTHVRLTQLRWMAGVMAPRMVRVKASEPAGARPAMDVLIRTFHAEIDPETGKERVVALCPNPVTGELERVDAPGWRPPAGAVLIPSG